MTNARISNLGRVVEITLDQVIFEWHDARSEYLDYTHFVAGSLTITEEPDWAQQGLQPDDLVINATLQCMLSTYHLWRTSDLREIAHAHELRLYARDTARSLIDRLSTHRCSRCCPTVLLIFRALRRPRTATQVERHRLLTVDTLANANQSYTDVANEELMRSIIEDWQDVVKTDNFIFSVCGPCGRRTSPSDATLVSPTDFDLTLLRNDGLPDKVKPSNYSLLAYDGALLNPKGLVDPWHLNQINMCEACRRELLEKRRMPQLCLANYLYYALDKVPAQVKDAFDSSTFTERRLIGRARCSRISYRFTELRKKKAESDDDTLEDSITTRESGSWEARRARSQRFTKGNVLVMPQNSTHLVTVLPPPPETIRDTVCAVFVGKSKPTKDTIGKLVPLLVRKSRLLLIIRFMMHENPHYKCDSDFHGFSQRNMDALFGPGTEGQDEGVPCALEIGFIDDNEAIHASVSGYTEWEDIEDETPPDDSAMLMENVGYTLGDETPQSYQDMKLKALSHCLSGGRFVRSQAGDRFVPDFENPSLLTWMFPHLDPWGIGGFHEPARERPVSMEEQLKYLLELDDSPFQRDPDFAFVYYNILQKKTICDSVRFRVKAAEQTRIVRRLLAVDKGELENLISKFKANSHYEPETQNQREMIDLVNKVGTILHDLPGTAGYKLKMRNEIRSLVNMRGTPAFFITLNPSDIHHPLVRLLSGDDIRLEHLEQGQELSQWNRKLLVARNPGACAKFFHTMISSFISIVLRHGKRERGLLGKCTGYYGTVEAQGRGTLHCHMLIWLQDHPSPQEMRDAMVDSAQYQADIFSWLESLIKCELLGTTMVVEEPDGPIQRPKLPKTPGYIHPSTTLGPSIHNVGREQFWLHFASDVNDLVTHTNWHQHTETCWKYLRRGEARTDETCRMRIDGTTRKDTTVDNESGSILLRRLHPRIANYNDVIIFLIRANMDIKHIGSGEAAKALIYYVTDYITKSSLPTHVGLAALLYAINRTSEKYKDVPNWEEQRSAGALTVVVNSMMARQEISHQQVMSYLIGGGDHYTSDKFRVLHASAFQRLVVRYWLQNDEPANNIDDTIIHRDERAMDSDDAPNGEIPNVEPIELTDVTSDCLENLRRPDDNVTLLLGASSISAVNQQHDYLYRPHEEPFASMGLYEYIGMTEKVSKDAESRRILRGGSQSATDRRRGRPAEARAEFSIEHPQYETHVIRKRTVWVIPVLLGEKMPRPDRSDDERDRWAQNVLTLFIPWRHPSDLKYDLESWIEAYERQVHDIAREHMSIIHNMNVLSECRDARDNANLARRAPRHPVPPLSNRPQSPDPFDVYDTPRREAPVVREGQLYDIEGDVRQLTLLQQLDKNIGIRFRHAVDDCFSREDKSAQDLVAPGTSRLLTEDMRGTLDAEHATMRKLKRKRRPDDTHDHVGDSDRNVRHRLNRPPILDSMRLGQTHSSSHQMNIDTFNFDTDGVVFQVILEKNLRSNPEQLRAFEIVSDHVINGGPQLMMYIGGVGGTGKSHVVNSILRLFSLLGRRSNILVAAPTGAAAIIIGGHTIHSLTLLPDGPGRDLQELCKIWKDVDYLILDEVSMIGARFLSQLHSRLLRAKGYHDNKMDLPFGGINMIFTGDFGQLRPVRDPPLYSHSLVNDPGLEMCQRKGGINALMGAYLWRKVNAVVLLKINQRQAGDRLYADLLGRIRAGHAKTAEVHGQQSDFAVLRTRYADRLHVVDPQRLSEFQDAPIIVGRKKLRDLLNLRIMGHHARRFSADVHLYHAKDKISGQFVSNEDRQVLWTMSSTITHDSLGKLPLFPGMTVMVQENLAFTNRVVNGTQGTVKDIVYEEEDGKRFPSVVYVHIPGSGSVCAHAQNDVVPIFPEWTTFTWSTIIDGKPHNISVSRLQVPLLPAYAYTDYKSQGRSLDNAIIDPASATTLQGVYVMLSRVRALEGLAILRPFKAAKIEQRLSQELRTELERLEEMDIHTRTRFPSTFGPLE